MAGLDPSIGQMKLSLRPELRVNRTESGGGVIYQLEDPVTGRLYEVGDQEYLLLTQLSSARTVQDWMAEKFPEQPDQTGEHQSEVVTSQLLSRPSTDELNQSEVTQILNWAIGKGLLQDAGEQLVQFQRRNAMQAKLSQASSWLNWISFRIPFGCPETTFQKIAPRLNWIFTPWFFFLWLVVIGWAALEFYFQNQRFWDQSDQVISEGKWVQLLVVWAVVKVIHEMAHGVAAHRYRSHIRGCGIMFILFMPMAYVDITSSAKLKSSWQRIIIAAAGMYIELLLAAVALILWATTESVAVSQWSYAMVISAGISTVLFNANPLMKFDGYFILSDLLGKKNLAEHGKLWLKSVCQRWILGVPYQHTQLESGWIVGTYGTLAAIWRVLLNLTLLISASALFYGLGVLVAVGSFFATYVLPFAMKLRQAFGKKTWVQWNPVNILASSSMAALLVFTVFQIFAGPATIDSPAVVRSVEKSIVRCQCNGFLKKWMVEPGEIVEKNQVLAECENPNIESKLREIQFKIRQSEVQCRILLKDNDLGNWKAEKRELEKLHQELEHQKSLKVGLTVRAESSGRVPEVRLSNLVGRFFNEGDPLFELIRDEKEVAISICQDDLPSLSRQVGQPVELRFLGDKTIPAKLGSISPRASEELLADSLSSTNGGTLSVRVGQQKPDDEFLDKNSLNKEGLVLAVPRITAVVKLTSYDSSHLKVGQTGTVYFQSQRQSLGSYLYLNFRRWIQHKLEQAGI